MAKANEKPPSPEKYQAFLQGLELRHVRLIELRVTTLDDDPKPAESIVSVEGRTEFVPTEGGFEARTRYYVSFSERKLGQELGAIEALYGFRYESEVKPNDEGAEAYFEIFSDVNMPVNSWPFMRELTYNMMARMGWTPFALPLLKPPASTPIKKPPATRRKKSG